MLEQNGLGEAGGTGGVINSRLILIINEYVQIKLICYFGRENKSLSCFNLHIFFFRTWGEANHCPFELREEECAGGRRVWGERPLCWRPLPLPTSCLWGQCIGVPVGLAEVRLQQRGCSGLVFYVSAPLSFSHLFPEITPWMNHSQRGIHLRLCSWVSAQGVLLIRMRFVGLKPRWECECWVVKWGNRNASLLIGVTALISLTHGICRLCVCKS